MALLSCVNQVHDARVRQYLNSSAVFLLFCSLLPASLQEFIETIGLYGVQKTDPNISYTSVGALCVIAGETIDYVGTIFHFRLKYFVDVFSKCFREG